MASTAASIGGSAKWRVRGRSNLSHAELPPWTRALAEGEDAGFFGPGSAVWAVNGALPTLVAGIRALLLQTLHPGAMAGVHDWSRYSEDPLGRLDGTVRWVATTTFGDRRSATAASAFVSRLHDHVRGTYVDAAGVERPYSANDPDLLRWVHDAFTEAFVGAHEIWGAQIPGGADAYVREWAQAGRLMGVAHPPVTLAELRAEMSGFLEHSKVDERVITAVPESLKHAICVGIGLLIALIGLEWSGIIVAAPGTLVTLGRLNAPPEYACRNQSRRLGRPESQT